MPAHPRIMSEIVCLALYRATESAVLIDRKSAPAEWSASNQKVKKPSKICLPQNVRTSEENNFWIDLIIFSNAEMEEWIKTSIRENNMSDDLILSTIDKV